jgi:hypothetical protein
MFLELFTTETRRHGEELVLAGFLGHLVCGFGSTGVAGKVTPRTERGPGVLFFFSLDMEGVFW